MKKINILVLADTYHANTENFIAGLISTESCTVFSETFDLPLRFRGKYYTNTLRFLLFLRLIFIVNKLVKRIRPDVIFGYRTTSYGFVASLVRKQNHIQVVAMQGSSDIYPPVHFFNPIKKRMLRWTYGRTDLLHAWGIEMQTNAIRLGATPEKILTMPRGINTNTFSIGKQALKSDHFVWLVSRQLNTEYNHNLIIRSFASLAKKIDVRIKLIIAGDGPLRNQLQDLAHELQLDSCIRFTGKVSNTELADLYVTADFYISLTDSEGVSASLLEAMASGCIPVVTKLPSNCEWVSNSNGVLVGELSIDEVEKAMKNAIENYLDLYELRYQNRLLVEQKADQKANAMFFVKKYRELIAQKLNTSPHPSE